MQPYATLFWAASSLVPYLLMVPVVAEVGVLDAAANPVALYGTYSWFLLWLRSEYLCSRTPRCSERSGALYRTYSWFLLWLRSEYLMQPYATLF